MKKKPPRSDEDQGTQLNIRLTLEEFDLLREASGMFPVSTWARAQLVPLAREEVRKRERKQKRTK